jgi:hypothetical protein
MEFIWSEAIDSVLKVGQPLADIGVNNWGLTKEDALIALNEFLKVGIAVLGGDVYIMSGRNIEPSYNNWYCSREKDESNIDFIKRSILKAENYISNYTDTKNNTLFALVPEI